MKICVIGVYFGKFPEYIDLWLRTCEFNKDVDFYIVCDTKLESYSENIHEIRMTLQDFKKLAEIKLNKKLVLEVPFKCCDYKPLYGLIMEDYIGSYDYWGYCDFDMLFGDIIAMAKKYELTKYDKFLTLGHFSLVRNTEEINRLPMSSKYLGSTFERMISTGDTIQFDELPGGVNDIMDKECKKVFKTRIYADISRLWKRIKLAERYIDSTDVNYPHQLFYWKEGRCFRRFIKEGEIEEEEYIYIHLKKRKYKVDISERERINQIVISPNKLLIKENITSINVDEIKKYNPYRGFLYEMIEEKILSRNRNHILPTNR